jgi:hypothetical protein
LEENSLTAEELDSFHQIPSGELLSEASLESALQSSAELDSDISTPELERRISLLEAELGWNEESLETLLHTKKGLADSCIEETRAQVSVREQSEKLRREERRRQEQVLETSVLFNTTLHQIRCTLEDLIHELQKTKPGVDEEVLLCRMNLSRVSKVESNLDHEIGLLITDLFGSRFSELGIGSVEKAKKDENEGLLDVGSDAVLELVRGRDKAEFFHLRSEINRVRVSIFRDEIARIEISAQASGVLAALGVLGRTLSGSWSSGSLILPISGPVKPNIALPEPDAKIRDQISDLVSACVCCYCEKILTTDYHLKYRRSFFVLNKMKILRDILLERRARQEILDILLLAETGILLDISETMKNLETKFEIYLRKLDGFKSGVESLVSGSGDKGKLILPEDSTFSNLHSILKISGLVDYLATYSGVETALSNLLSDKANLAEKIRRDGNSRLRDLEEKEISIRRLSSSLRIDIDSSLKPLCLVPREISRGISGIDRGMKDLELKMKKLLTDWEMKKTELKTKPYYKLQREVWIDFLIKPDILSANIRAVQNKLKDLS